MGNSQLNLKYIKNTKIDGYVINQVSNRIQIADIQVFT